MPSRQSNGIFMRLCSDFVLPYSSYLYIVFSPYDSAEVPNYFQFNNFTANGIKNVHFEIIFISQV